MIKTDCVQAIDLSQLGRIKGICYDFDGIFYDLNKLPGYHAIFASAYAETMCAHFTGIVDFEQGVQMAHKGYELYGSGVIYLQHWVKEHRLETPTIIADFFRDFHRNLYQAVKKAAPELFEPQETLVSIFRRSHGEIPCGIATHGCAENMSRPLLRDMGLSAFIPLHTIFGLNQSDYVGKSTAPTLVEMCFAAMGVDSDEGAFVEDSTANLELFKAVHPGCCTIYFHHEKPFEELPDYIDYQFADMLEFQQALQSVHPAFNQPHMQHSL